MRQIADRIGALVGYVRQEFPGCDVWDRIDTDRSVQTVSVAIDDGLLLLTASFEFLSDNSPAEVGACLRAWHVAHALSAAKTIPPLNPRSMRPQTALNCLKPSRGWSEAASPRLAGRV